jgi:hypothetical protein
MFTYLWSGFVWGSGEILSSPPTPKSLIILFRGWWCLFGSTECRSFQLFSFYPGGYHPGSDVRIESILMPCWLGSHHSHPGLSGGSPTKNHPSEWSLCAHLCSQDQFQPIQLCLMGEIWRSSWWSDVFFQLFDGPIWSDDPGRSTSCHIHPHLPTSFGDRLKWKRCI